MLRYQEIDWFGFLFRQNKYVSVCSRVSVCVCVSCFHSQDGTTVFTLSVLIGYSTLNAYLILLLFVVKSARPS